MNPHRVLLALLLAGCAPRARPSTSQDVLITNVTLISPERSAPLAATDVLIRGSRIAAIGPALRTDAQTTRIDGRGRFLIPGLIDSHVHVGNAMALDDAIIERRPELLAAYRAQLPRAYLAFGFTTLVDVDSRPETRAWFDATPLHPRLLHCGRAVRVAGGYGAQRVPADAQPQQYAHLLYEPSAVAFWPRTLEPAEHTPARVVQQIVDSGGRCVKTFVESGFGIFNWPVPSPATLGALRAEANAHGLPLLVHATSVDAWRAALNARADVVAHGLWHWPGTRSQSIPPEEARAIIASVARAGVRVQPTLRVLQSDRALFEPNLMDDPRFAWALPHSIIEYLHSPEGQAVRRAAMTEYEDAARGVGETIGAKALIDVAIARVTATTRLLYDAGGALIFGSDTPAGDQGVGNPPGLNGRLELQQWADAGIPLARILRAATLDNAAAFHLDRELGSIEVGKWADLLLLSASPLETVTAYDTIEMVFVNGKPIARETLRPAR
jgi:imidazolonepropionase-like amidohydrolase